MTKKATKDLSESDPENRSENRPENRLELYKLIPNMITLMALMSGLTAIQFAIKGRIEVAVTLILVAAILDMLDGATARLLNAKSELGAQLDSLSDFLCFGVAPAFILYMWGLDEAGKLGWIATTAYAAACALRLARFNITKPITEKKSAWNDGFFQGVPAPAGAGLSMLPLFIWFQSPETFSTLSFANPLIGVWTIFVAALMISRIPTWSSKQIHFHKKMALPIMAGGALVFASLLHAPWTTLMALSFAYLISIPCAFRKFRKTEQSYDEASEDLTDLALGIGKED
ncbi:MAG: CDP-alcohol phosphatidyltransferase family protein [Bdellovibrionales bacterium]